MCYLFNFSIKFVIWLLRNQLYAYKYVMFSIFVVFRDNYEKRFPELDSLVPTPLEYMRTVKELGNDLDKYKNNEALQQVKTPCPC